MYKSVKDKILSRIYGYGRGWVFSANDFLVDFSRYEIDTTLNYEVYDASNTDEPLADLTALDDSAQYIIKFIKVGEQTSATVTITKNN